jgi:hypothetical protein
MLGVRIFQVWCYGRDTPSTHLKWCEGTITKFKTAAASTSSSGTENRHSSRSRSKRDDSSFVVLFEEDNKKVAVELKTQLYTSDKAAVEGSWFVFGTNSDLSKLVVS